MYKNILILVFILIPGAVFAGDPMEGRQKTDRTIRLTAVVSAKPEQVFRLWTTEEGIRKFFAPKARIGSRPGDPYEIIFEPDLDPDGSSFGTKGAHLLRIEKNRRIAFEWITFVATQNASIGPPYAPPEERNVSPLPTWVEIEMNPAASDPGKTDIRLTHYGFRSGGKWDDSFLYFQKAWAGVLQNLEKHCREASDSAAL